MSQRESHKGQAASAARKRARQAQRQTELEAEARRKGVSVETLLQAQAIAAEGARLERQLRNRPVRGLPAALTRTEEPPQRSYWAF